MELHIDDFRKVLAGIRPYVKKTTLLRCKALESYLKTECRIFLKLENEQPTGSFKFSIAALMWLLSSQTSP